MARTANAFVSQKNELKIRKGQSADRNHANNFNSGAVSVKNH